MGDSVKVDSYKTAFNSPITQEEYLTSQINEPITQELREGERESEVEEREEKYINYNCSINNTYQINLDNIQISEDRITEGSQNVKSSYASRTHTYFIPGLLKYNDIDLPVIKYLSHGTYGYVYQYSSLTELPENWTEINDNRGTYYEHISGRKTYDRPRNPEEKYYSIAVKVLLKKNDKEISIIENINNYYGRGICNTINARNMVINNNFYNKQVNIVVMDMMDNSLDKLPKPKNSKELIDILKYLAETLLCLTNINYAYTDLKLGNILYKCYDDNKIKIVLGDLGSLCNIGKNGTSTYIPPEIYIYKRVICNEENMVWCLGVLVLELLNIDVKPFYHKNVINYKSLPRMVDYINKYLLFNFSKLELNNVILNKLEGVTDDNITLLDLLWLIFSIDLKTRIKLQQIINVL